MNRLRVFASLPFWCCLATACGAAPAPRGSSPPATSSAADTSEAGEAENQAKPDGPETANEDEGPSRKELEETKAELASLPPFAAVRAQFATAIVSEGDNAGPADAPPATSAFAKIKYQAAAGPLVAYVTKDPGDGKRHPAIIWITGGDNNSIGDVWSPADAQNDQTAAAYRQAGMVMMFPSQRGGNDNPGRREGFVGEVDDIIAARAHLAALPYVDANRIYLGGHSTGGTLALLVAESTDAFRAVFAFGPAAHIGAYGGAFMYADPNEEMEILMRSPMFWLKDIRSPTFVLEGIEGNSDSLRVLNELNDNDAVRFYEVDGTDHFAILAPTNELIARKLLADTGDTVGLSIEANEVQRLFTPR